MAGYWIIRGSEIRNQAAFDEYSQLWKPVAQRFGARMIAGAGRRDTREGPQFARVLVVEFPSFEQAVACYDDPDYQAALIHARRAYERELIIIEGS